jgi:hypothetical protein
MKVASQNPEKGGFFFHWKVSSAMRGKGGGSQDWFLSYWWLIDLRHRKFHSDM